MKRKTFPASQIKIQDSRDVFHRYKNQIPAIRRAPIIEEADHFYSGADEFKV